MNSRRKEDVQPVDGLEGSHTINFEYPGEAMNYLPEYLSTT